MAPDLFPDNTEKPEKKTSPDSIYHYSIINFKVINFKVNYIHSIDIRQSQKIKPGRLSESFS